MFFSNNRRTQDMGNPTLEHYAQTVESILHTMGVDPSQARLNTEQGFGWGFRRGSAIIEILDYRYAISQLAQTTMRDIVGEMELDELLANREEVSQRIRGIVDSASDPWGIEIVSVELKHIELPQDLKRTIGKQAEAERERRAVIIKAEGEVASAENMAKAAEILSRQAGALHLRTLQSLNDLSSDQSNTVVFAVPLEILRAFEGKKEV